MNDSPLDDIHDAVRDVSYKRNLHMKDLLDIAALSGCGIEATTKWVRTDAGYVLESEVALAPDLPPYVIREAGECSTREMEEVVTQYAPRDEGGQGPA